VGVDVDASLYPWQLRPAGCDEVKDIGVVKVKVADDCTILVDPTTSQDFVEG
jgi:hypothetical protein